MKTQDFVDLSQEFYVNLIPIKGSPQNDRNKAYSKRSKTSYFQSNIHVNLTKIMIALTVLT